MMLLTSILGACHSLIIAVHGFLWVVDGPLYEHHGHHVSKKQEQEQYLWHKFQNNIDRFLEMSET